MAEFQSYREGSKTNWGTNNEGKLNLEQIHIGAMLRIADATEVMAQNYVAMQIDLDMYKRWHKEEQEKSEKLLRSNNALRGYLNRLKKLKNKL